jgi:hypothetical protein
MAGSETKPPPSPGREPQKKGAVASSDGGPGEPKEAVDALLKAVLRLPAGPTPDPDVSTAFSLGWRLGELRAAEEPKHFAAPDETSPVDPYLSELDDRHRSEFARRQIDTACRRLAKRLGDDEDDDRKSDVDSPQARYEELLIGCWAADPHLGKALGLGRLTYALTRLEYNESDAEDQRDEADTQQLQDDNTVVDEALQRFGPQVKKALSDLASLLPDNAAHSVLNSLSLWEDEKNLGRAAEAERDLPGRKADGQEQRPDSSDFRAQGDRWRSVLSGEMAARDLVQFRDYLGSIEGLAAQFWELTKEGIRKFWPIAIAALVLLGVGILLLAIGSSSVAAAGSILAAFGLSWKGAGGFIGKPIAKGEQDLWDAQMDWTIAYRMTTISKEATEEIERKLGTLGRRERRKWAHLEDFLEWQRRLPAAASSSAPLPLAELARRVRK